MLVVSGWWLPQTIISSMVLVIRTGMHIARRRKFKPQATGVLHHSLAVTNDAQRPARPASGGASGHLWLCSASTEDDALDDVARFEPHLLAAGQIDARRTYLRRLAQQTFLSSDPGYSILMVPE